MLKIQLLKLAPQISKLHFLIYMCLLLIDLFLHLKFMVSAMTDFDKTKQSEDGSLSGLETIGTAGEVYITSSLSLRLETSKSGSGQLTGNMFTGTRGIRFCMNAVFLFTKNVIFRQVVAGRCPEKWFG